MATNPNDVRLTVLVALQEAYNEEACLEEQILSLMHHFADRFTNSRPEINRLMTLHDHPLIEYGRYALGCMIGADMKKATYLKSVRDELLRSMEEKLLEKLTDEAVKQVDRVQGIHSELESLKKTLLRIQALLVDASDKEIKDVLVQNWLNDLRHLAYDIDDILDDLATDDMHPEFVKNSGASTSK
nr:NB-ARC domains-containing protein [Tanacetum cinerariifolium]